MQLLVQTPALVRWSHLGPFCASFGQFACSLKFLRVISSFSISPWSLQHTTQACALWLINFPQYQIPLSHILNFSHTRPRRSRVVLMTHRPPSFIPPSGHTQSRLTSLAPRICVTWLALPWIFMANSLLSFSISWCIRRFLSGTLILVTEDLQLQKFEKKIQEIEWTLFNGPT